MGTNSVREVWDKISELGTANIESDNLRRNIIVSNQIGAVLFAFSLLIGLTVVVILPSNSLVISWFGGLAFSLGIFLWLNSIGQINASRLLLSFVLPFIIVGATVHTRIMYPDIVHDGSYYIPRYYMIGTIVIPLLIFSFEEKIPLILAILSSMVLMMLYNPLHHYFGVAPQDFGHEVKEESFISVSTVMSAIIIVSGSIFLIRLNAIYEGRIKALLAETDQKNKDIESSIRYAKRLQTALLPSSKGNAVGGDSQNLFILYKPKDIVSGDFYQIHDFGNQKLLAVVDCTGHGVPGAFMSIISSNALRRAVREAQQVSPDNILKKANELISEEFNKEVGYEIRDGMDVSLCLVDQDKKEIQFSGTNQRLYYVENGEMVEYRAKMEHGDIDSKTSHFDLVKFNYNAGGQIYMTTDGLPDQFGGDDDKKFGRKRIKETFLNVSQLPVMQQGKVMEETISTWIGKGEQTDDMCVLGFKLV